jgi:hypothetical protein
VRHPDSFAVGRRARVDKVARGKTGSERGESERGQNRTKSNIRLVHDRHRYRLYRGPEMRQ